MKNSSILLFCFLIGYSSTLSQSIEPNSCSGIDALYIINHGWHTGIAIKTEGLNQLLPILAIRFPHRKYYEIGWGDKGFYQANEITINLSLRAMFWSSGSVIHIVGFDENPKQRFQKSDVQEIKISHENYNDLLKFIKSSFQTDITGNIIQGKHGIYGDSQFYIGTGTYHLFNTCNKWTAKALSVAGLDIDPMFKLTASSVMNSLEQECVDK